MKKKFYVYPGARLAVQALGIRTLREYNSRYREDSKLPANPRVYYSDVGWIDWYDFLGGVRANYYASYSEARSAAQLLGIKNNSDYRARCKEDIKLPLAPNHFYAENGWVNWYDFLGKEKSLFYETYYEAQVAVSELGIRSQPEYVDRHREDSKLPVTPQSFYSDLGWTNWYVFLGNAIPSYYDTYSEAQAAAQALGIKSLVEYRDRYREDLKLPSRPDIKYLGLGWTDLYDFLGVERSKFYENYSEAHAAVRKLGIKSMSEYRERYHEDPCLPSKPYLVYANVGWTDRYEFLGKEKPNLYRSYVEARAAVQNIGIKSYSQYVNHARDDPRLPANPQLFYAGIGWTDFYDFFGTEDPQTIVYKYPLIWADVERWLKNETGITAKKTAIKAFLSWFQKSQYLVDDARHILLRGTVFNAGAYQEFIEKQAESQKRPFHNGIKAFFNWVMEEYCTDTDADTYERVVLPEYRNPFEKVLAGFYDSLKGYRSSQSTKTPLGYEYILRARNYLVPNGEQVLQARLNFKDLPHLQDFFNGRTDWVYVDESVIDYSDPNCIWRKVERADRIIDGKRQLVSTYQIWSPVRFVAMYTLLRFPLRGQQVLWLDSGEADEEIAVLYPDGIHWERNTGALVGKGTKKRRAQSAVQRGDRDAPKIYITTNKTGRQEGGYDVEWIPDDLLYWLLMLRDWQAKYNPLPEPTRWSDIMLRAETNERILMARGTQCFLFRMFGSGQPAFTTTAFTHTLPALLFAIQRPGENLAFALDNSKSNGQRFVSPYTPHSLRVSLITAFIADGDAPVYLISKLVGHASLVMTIYYTKLNSLQMRRAMGETEKRAAKIITERHAETIRTEGLTPLRHQLIATTGNRSLLDTDVPNSACVVFDCGICPMSAAACHIGGEVLAERKVERIVSPVAVGYLGQKNCLRCRFFITGVPFLGGLVAVANEIALEIHTESGRFQSYVAEFDHLEAEFYYASKAFLPDVGKVQRKQADANQQQSAAKLDGLVADYVAANHYIQSCLKLINEGGDLSADNNIRLIAAENLSEIGVAFEEGETNYHLLAEICQNATIYTSANPSRAMPLISQLIDRMLENNGMAPSLFKLEDEQKLVVANELNALLLERLGSWEKIDNLFSGELMLLDFDAHDPELTPVSSEIKMLLSNSNRRHQLNFEEAVHD